MDYTREDLDAAHRHLEQAKRHVRIQCDILDHLRQTGGAADLAERLLADFEASLADHRRAYERIESRLKARA